MRFSHIARYVKTTLIFKTFLKTRFERPAVAVWASGFGRSKPGASARQAETNAVSSVVETGEIWEGLAHA